MGYSDRDFTAMRQLSESKAKCKPPMPEPPPLRVECGYCHYVFSKGNEFDNHKCCAEVRIFRFMRGLFK